MSAGLGPFYLKFAAEVREFYNFLLSHQEVRKDLVHLLVDDLYNGLRRDEN